MERKRKKKKKKKEKNTLQNKKRSRDQNILNEIQLCNNINEGEHITIKFQKKNEVCNEIPPQIPVVVEPFAVMKNMMSCFDKVFTT